LLKKKVLREEEITRMGSAKIRMKGEQVMRSKGHWKASHKYIRENQEKMMRKR